MFWQLHFGLFLWLLFSSLLPIIVFLHFWPSFLALSSRANFLGFYNFFWAIDSQTCITISLDLSWTSNLPACPAGPQHSAYQRENLSSLLPFQNQHFLITYPHALMITLRIALPLPNQLWPPPFTQRRSKYLQTGLQSIFLAAVQSHSSQPFPTPLHIYHQISHSLHLWHFTLPHMPFLFPTL